MSTNPFTYRAADENIQAAVHLWCETGVGPYGRSMSTWIMGDVTNMDSLFNGVGDCAAPLTADVSNWNTERVTSMNRMFKDFENFNFSLGDWDVSRVTSMEGMFSQAKTFNQDLSKWNTSKVVDMSNMFFHSETFNGNITDWNTARVESMSSMFDHAKQFNSEIGSWDTTKVLTMSYMFYNAAAFNQPLGWNTNQVTTMSNMFNGAVSFQQNLLWLPVFTVQSCENFCYTCTEFPIFGDCGFTIPVVPEEDSGAPADALTIMYGVACSVVALMIGVVCMCLIIRHFSRVREVLGRKQARIIIDNEQPHELRPMSTFPPTSAWASRIGHNTTANPVDATVAVSQQENGYLSVLGQYVGPSLEPIQTSGNSTATAVAPPEIHRMRQLTLEGTPLPSPQATSPTSASKEPVSSRTSSRSPSRPESPQPPKYEDLSSMGLDPSSQVISPHVKVSRRLTNQNTDLYNEDSVGPSGTFNDDSISQFGDFIIREAEIIIESISMPTETEAAADESNSSVEIKATQKVTDFEVTPPVSQTGSLELTNFDKPDSQDNVYKRLDPIVEDHQPSHYDRLSTGGRAPTTGAIGSGTTTVAPPPDKGTYFNGITIPSDARNNIVRQASRVTSMSSSGIHSPL